MSGAQLKRRNVSLKLLEDPTLVLTEEAGSGDLRIQELAFQKYFIAFSKLEPFEYSGNTLTTLKYISFLTNILSFNCALGMMYCTLIGLRNVLLRDSGIGKSSDIDSKSNKTFLYTAFRFLGNARFFPEYNHRLSASLANPEYVSKLIYYGSCIALFFTVVSVCVATSCSTWSLSIFVVLPQILPAAAMYTFYSLYNGVSMLESLERSRYHLKGA
ncbi:hypothetical protein BB560_001254 [Smittium megazygosporum]|uniref:Uncharacterized protein n=1 Tax=Smittium megazygosporum TaxID=133381 RepID=A0A2T9ZBT9_9FUNG|nr:hypothetical protein BB560_003496 [Smittium megazygosporum]PVV04238.1 hypothetical protein BB560_001254 [Smittium megazygosporum]